MARRIKRRLSRIEKFAGEAEAAIIWGIAEHRKGQMDQKDILAAVNARLARCGEKPVSRTNFNVFLKQRYEGGDLPARLTGEESPESDALAALFIRKLVQAPEFAALMDAAIERSGLSERLSRLEGWAHEPFDFSHLVKRLEDLESRVAALTEAATTAAPTGGA